MSPTRAEAIRAAARLSAEHAVINAARTPRELAEAAWHPNSPYSVDEIEDRIRTKRGLPEIHSKAS